MGTVEVWLSPAGCGKTGAALEILARELAGGGLGTRMLAPTVAHKRAIEGLLLTRGTPGLFGDPVTTFFNFAEEVARLAAVPGRTLSELQKHLLLKRVVRQAELDYFKPAQAYPGFVTALGEEIDELKVHMVRPERLAEAAQAARAGGAPHFARKLTELWTLYNAYQGRVLADKLFDNEGMMWIAAECLKAQPALFPVPLRYLILDGFARLTPIQVEVLAALAPVVQERIILLFDFVPGRPLVNHPVEESIIQLERALPGEIVRRMDFPCAVPRTALQHLRAQLFAPHPVPRAVDDSVHLLLAATPAQEAELMAREVRALLRAGRRPEEIAILARNADAVHERLARTFARYNLPLRRGAPALAHTPVGRALLAALRLVRDGWARRDVLALLKSGLLPLDPAAAFQVDLIARSQYLRDRRATWRERWPDDDTRDALQAALDPPAAFDALFHRKGVTAAELLEGAAALVAHFRAVALPEAPPVPDVDAEAAARYTALLAAFTALEGVFEELRSLGDLLGGFPREDVLEVLTTAVLRAVLPTTGETGIPVLSVHAAGGEKFPVVFLCHLLEGAFPQHQRGSAFLLDHEREETLPHLDVPLQPRRHLEDDEGHWFLHALASATERLVLSYPCNDSNGGRLERSSFLDAVEAVLPDLAGSAHTASFKDVIPPLEDAESEEEYLAGLAVGLRGARGAAQATVAAAYAAMPGVHGRGSVLATLFRRAGPREGALEDAEAVRQLAARTTPFSASELQSHRDCPFLWFAGSLLGVAPVIEEFSALDRGSIIHAVLERLYRARQPRRGVPVHLEAWSFDELWPGVDAELGRRLDEEPRFRNRAPFLRDVERESLRRLLARFLHRELERAVTRKAHPAFFEHQFGARDNPPLRLRDGRTALRGTIDRIDLADDDPARALVLDYKSSSASITGKELEAGGVLQAPVYLLALRTLFGFTPLGAEFMGIKQGEAKGIYGPGAAAIVGAKEQDAARWQTYLADAESTLIGLADAVRSGEIGQHPTTPRCPDKCEYWSLCRGNRFELNRRLRESKAGETIGAV